MFVVDLMNVLQPETVKAMHQAFYDAGARLLTTNTFCCDPDSLANTGYSAEALCLAGAELAREVAGQTAQVAGSLGPGWRYPSHEAVDERALRNSYAERARGLIQGGVDWLWIETVQDPLQAEIAVAGCQDALRELKRDVPIAVLISLTTPETLIGKQALSTVLERLNALPVSLMGVNCSGGPESVRQALGWLRIHSDKQLACLPNAGPGPGAYALPEAFAADMAALAETFKPDIIGGCCGTTPEHIQALAQMLKQDKSGS